MIAVLLPEHIHHARAIAAVNRRLDAGDMLALIGHALLETYSSLTRMPPPSRLTPVDALRGIQTAFLRVGRTFVIPPDGYAQLLRDLARDGVLGGQVYDAAIVACARLAGASVILTFNEQHFRRFAGHGLTVEVP